MQNAEEGQDEYNTYTIFIKLCKRQLGIFFSEQQIH